jgi:hypothetical protein
MLFLIGIACLVGGGFRRYSLREYEFENRTAGGVVQFESYSGSLSHGFKVGLTTWILLIGIVCTLLGLIEAVNHT